MENAVDQRSQRKTIYIEDRKNKHFYDRNIFFHFIIHGKKISSKNKMEGKEEQMMKGSTVGGMMVVHGGGWC